MSDSESSGSDSDSSPPSSPRESKPGFFERLIPKCRADANVPTADDLIARQEYEENQVQTAATSREVVRTIRHQSTSFVDEGIRKNVSVNPKFVEVYGPIVKSVQVVIPETRNRLYPQNTVTQVFEIDEVAESADPQALIEFSKKINRNQRWGDLSFSIYQWYFEDSTDGSQKPQKPFRVHFPIPLHLRDNRPVLNLRFMFELEPQTLQQLVEDHKKRVEAAKRDGKFGRRPQGIAIPLNIKGTTLASSYGISDGPFHVEVLQIHCENEQSNLPVVFDKILGSGAMSTTYDKKTNKVTKTTESLHWATPSGLLSNSPYKDDPFHYSYNPILPNSQGKPDNNVMFVGDETVLTSPHWSRWGAVNWETVWNKFKGRVLHNPDKRPPVYKPNEMIPGPVSTVYVHKWPKDADDIMVADGDVIAHLVQDEWGRVCRKTRELLAEQAKFTAFHRTIDERPFYADGPKWCEPVDDFSGRKVSYIPFDVVHDLLEEKQNLFKQSDHLLNLNFTDLMIYTTAGESAWKYIEDEATSQIQRAREKQPALYNCTINIVCRAWAGLGSNSGNTNDD